MHYYLDTEVNSQTNTRPFDLFSNSYSSIPDNKDLSETKAKTTEIFGTFYTDLPEKIERRKNVQNISAKFYLAADFFTRTGVCAVGVLILNQITPVPVGELITGCVLCSIVRAYDPIEVSQTDTKRLKKSEDLLDVCEKIANFSNAFNAFKNSPSEDDIKPLFHAFNIFTHSASIWQQGNLNLGRIPTDFTVNDLSLMQFGGVGRVFLMDAVVTIIKEKDANASIVTQWEKKLKTTILEDYQEPWANLDIKQPSTHKYIKFGIIRENFKSVEIADRMIEVFQKLLKKEVEKY